MLTHIPRQNTSPCHRGINQFLRYNMRAEKLRKKNDLTPYNRDIVKIKIKRNKQLYNTGNQWTNGTGNACPRKKRNSDWNAERQWNKRTIFQLCLLPHCLQSDLHLVVLSFQCLAFPLQKEITTVTRSSELRQS